MSETATTETIQQLAKAAKRAARAVAASPAETRHRAREGVAAQLGRSADTILTANVEDVREFEPAVARGEMTKATLDRLKLSAARHPTPGSPACAP